MYSSENITGRTLELVGKMFYGNNGIKGAVTNMSVTELQFLTIIPMYSATKNKSNCM